MKLATLTADFDPYCERFVDRIFHIYEAGFRYVDLTLSRWNKNYDLMESENCEAHVEEVNAFMKEKGMEFVQCHGPSTNPMESETRFAEDIEKTTHAIEICGRLGIPQIVVHSGWRKGATKEEWFAENAKFYRIILQEAEKYNIAILHENETGNNIPHFVLKTGAAMREFSEYVNHPLFHSCWDIGHAKIEGAQYNEILAMGDDLWGIHVHDNCLRDEHLIPFMGTINMAEVMQGLIDVGYKGPFTFEACSALRPSKYWLGNRMEFGNDSRLLEPTLEMQKALEVFLYRVGEHILKTFDVFEG